MRPSATNSGILYVLGGAALWGLFPVVSAVALRSIGPLLAAAVSTLISGVFFLAIIAARGQWKDLRDRRGWKPALASAFYIGICYFGLQFAGLRFTTPGNASIISLMEVFWTFLIISLLLKHETLHPRTIAGALCMVAGAAVVFAPSLKGGIHIGDLFILASAAFPPLGNKAMQQARRHVGSPAIMAIRSVIAGVVLLALSLAVEGQPSVAGLHAALPLLLFSGTVLFGFSKLLWIEGLHRMPITVAAPLICTTPICTLLASAVILHQPVSGAQLLSLVPMAAGIWLLTRGNAKQAATLAA